MCTKSTKSSKLLMQFRIRSCNWRVKTVLLSVITEHKHCIAFLLLVSCKEEKDLLLFLFSPLILCIAH